MNWPEEMTPERTPVYARNEMAIPVEPERVWSWLVHAKRWPEWYSNCSRIRLSTDELGPASEFTWKTFGVALHSTVHVFEPGVAIEWDARGPAGIRAYHGWRIDFDGHESHVVTEETQAIYPLPLRWANYYAIWLSQDNSLSLYLFRACAETYSQVGMVSEEAGRADSRSGGSDRGHEPLRGSPLQLQESRAANY